MAQLTGKAKLWLVSGHVVIAAVWFGTALTMVAIALYASRLYSLPSASGDSLYSLQAILAYLNDYLLMPAATLSILSGTALCALTVWGFFKHYWVIAKWVITVTTITAVSGWVGPWVYAATAIAETDRLQALENPLFRFDQQAAMIGGSLEILALLGLILISFLKPWGRRPVKVPASDN
jgi:CBS domain containing-hemolysin-like protein